MCEIFPEFYKCCFCCSIRIAMLFISVFAIVSGVLLWSGVEKVTGLKISKMENITVVKNDLEKVLVNNPIDLEAAKKFAKVTVEKTPVFLPFVLAAIGIEFIVGGIILLYATLANSDGLVQLFVWMTFVTVLVGFLLVLILGTECFIWPQTCSLKALDWVSTSGTLLFFIAVLFLWLYLISVANSYVLQN